MSMGSGEAFPTTEVFLRGATPSRVMQAAKIIPTLLERRWRGIRPSVVDRHHGIGRGVISHSGWRLRRQDTHLPDAYDPAAHFASSTIVSSSLYIHESGRLDACVLESGQSPDELILDDELMRHYDAHTQGQESYTLRDTRSVAYAITLFARKYDIVNDHLIRFASADPGPVA